MTGLNVATDTTVVVDGLTMYTRRRRGTSQPPLLLIQGIGGSLAGWAPLLAQLPDRDIVMVDAPGAGRSQRPPVPIRMPRIADRIVAAVATLGITRFDVLGYSMGGMIAQEVARRNPALVRKLILTGTSCGLGATPGHWSMYTGLLSVRRFYNRDAAVKTLVKLGGGRAAREPHVMADIVDTREGESPSILGYYYQMSAVTGWSSRGWLRRLDTPTLIVHGEADPIVPAANGRKLARLIPGARFVGVPDAGHLLMFDESAKAAAVIDDFLTNG